MREPLTAGSKKVEKVSCPPIAIPSLKASHSPAQPASGGLSAGVWEAPAGSDNEPP